MTPKKLYHNTANRTSSELFKSPTIRDKEGKYKDLEIFMNPNRSDVREILYSEFSKGTTPYVNFFIDFKHKTTFIWNGEYASHTIASRIVSLNIHEETIVSGIAEILPNAKLNALALYQGKRNFDAFKWDWLDHYFPKISDEYKILAERKIVKANIKVVDLCRHVPKFLRKQGYNFLADGVEASYFKKDLVLKVQGFDISKNLIVLSPKIVDVRQATPYTCGVSCVQAILNYYGLDKREGEVAKQLRTTRNQGTSPQQIVRGFKHYGLDTVAKQNTTLKDLKTNLKHNIPTIVAIQAWSKNPSPDWQKDWEDGHWVVITGMDDENIIFEDPSLLGKRGLLAQKEFLSRWHDYKGPAPYNKNKNRDKSFIHLSIAVYPPKK